MCHHSVLDGLLGIRLLHLLQYLA